MGINRRWRTEGINYVMFFTYYVYIFCVPYLVFKFLHINLYFFVFVCMCYKSKHLTVFSCKLHWTSLTNHVAFTQMKWAGQRGSDNESWWGVHDYITTHSLVKIPAWHFVAVLFALCEIQLVWSLRRTPWQDDRRMTCFLLPKFSLHIKTFPNTPFVAPS